MLFRQVESRPVPGGVARGNCAIRRIIKHNLNVAVLVSSVFVFRANFCHAQDATRTVEVHAKRFTFSPAEITVKKGESVKLVLTSGDVTHSLVIPDLNVNQIIKKGHTAELTVIPTKAGDFKGICGHFCGSGHGLMIFTVHVTGN